MSVDVCIVVSWVAANGLPLAAGGDLGALYCQPAQKLNRSTNFQLTMSPPLAASGCWLLAFSSSFAFFSSPDATNEVS